MKIQLPKVFKKNSFPSCEGWQKWYAWYPVIVNDKLIVFEYVERKKVLNKVYFETIEEKVYNHEYREMNISG